MKIFEAQYDTLVKSLKTRYPERTADIDAQVKWAKTALVKADRITWYLRIIAAFMSGDDAKLKALIGNYRWSGTEQLGLDITHFLGIEDAAIQNYQFIKQPASQVISDLTKMEDAWKAKNAKKAKPVTPKTGDRVLIDFGNGLEWWFVDRAYCSDEGRSGNHCGNVVGRTQTDQRILSLRKSGHVLLTFILEPNGTLGEMKAAGNQKPAEKYHPAIVKLLMWDKITGISGQGYLPDANFSVFDLDEKYLQYLDQHKPVLITTQCAVTPIQILKSPEPIRQKYAEYAIEANPAIQYIIDDPSHESWHRAIDETPKLILYAPHDLPGFENRLAEFFESQYDDQTPGALLSAPASINRNRGLIKRILKVCPSAIGEVLPTMLDEELCTIAVKTDGSALDFVPEELRTEELCWAAVKTDGSALDFVPEELRTEEICLAAVKTSSYALAFTPDKFKTTEICLAAVKTSSYALTFIPDKFKTTEICLAAVKSDGMALRYVPEELRTKEICLTAVKDRGNALAYVPAELVDEIKQKLSIAESLESKIHRYAQYILESS